LFQLFITINQGVHEILFSAFSSFPENGVEHLAFAQAFKDDSFFNIDAFEIKKILMISLIDPQFCSVLYDMVFKFLKIFIDNCTAFAICYSQSLSYIDKLI